jgi:predicted nucleic acid-binding protein
VRRIFVDTSALLALLDRDDPRHPDARAAMESPGDDVPLTHGYVVAESIAVARRRFGIDGVVALVDGLLPIVNLIAVDGDTHRSALAAYRASLPSGTSFVDQVSLAVIAQANIDAAFALDPDLGTAGIALLPA